MKIPLDDLILRRPVWADAEAVVAFQIRRDIDQTGEAGSSSAGRICKAFWR